jgi:hypothetical protein
MEPFPTHLTGTVPGGLGLPCEGTAGSSPSSRGLTHGTFLQPPCCHTRRPWGDPVGAQQAAAPPGEVSRSAGSLGGLKECWEPVGAV